MHDLHLLDLVIRHLQAQLLNADLDRVPARQAGCAVHVAGHAKVGGVYDLVGAGVIEVRLGVDAGLVGEGAEARDGIVEGRVDLHRFGNQILELC